MEQCAGTAPADREAAADEKEIPAAVVRHDAKLRNLIAVAVGDPEIQVYMRRFVLGWKMLGLERNLPAGSSTCHRVLKHNHRPQNLWLMIFARQMVLYY